MTTPIQVLIIGQCNVLENPQPLAEVLQPPDFQVIATCATAEEGLDGLDALSPGVVIVVMVDVVLPDGDGLALCRQITRHPDLAVILVADNADELLTRNAMLAGARWLIKRRMTVPALAVVIRKVYDGHQPLRRQQAILSTSTGLFPAVPVPAAPTPAPPASEVEMRDEPDTSDSDELSVDDPVATLEALASEDRKEARAREAVAWMEQLMTDDEPEAAPAAVNPEEVMQRLNQAREVSPAEIEGMFDALFQKAEQFADRDDAFLVPDEAPSIEAIQDMPDWLREAMADAGDVSATALLPRQKDRPLNELEERLQTLRESGITLPAPDDDSLPAASLPAASLPAASLPAASLPAETDSAAGEAGGAPDTVPGAAKDELPPDWFRPSDPEPAAEMPDWLRGHIEGSELAPAADKPSWLASTDLQPEEVPDWLRHTLQDEQQPALPGAEFVPEGETAGNIPRMSSPADSSTAHFSAYYPDVIQPGQECGLYVYAHEGDALSAVRQDVRRFSSRLGGTIPEPTSASRTAKLAHGTLLTVVPECDGLEFEPPLLTRRWKGDWTRFEFDFTPAPDMTRAALTVHVSVQVAGIEIAQLACPLLITRDTPVSPGKSLNPLMDARLKSITARMYQKIFISYSRKDMAVAEACRQAQLAIGHDVFMDTHSLRGGENWQAALARAIDEADIFQLFWSEHSAASEYCRYEWDYALKYRCPETRCEAFIRPVYWTQPMPATPPPELSHLNFRYVPLTLAVAASPQSADSAQYPVMTLTGRGAVPVSDDTPDDMAITALSVPDPVNQVNARIDSIEGTLNRVVDELAGIRKAVEGLYRLLEQRLKLDDPGDTPE